MAKREMGLRKECRVIKMVHVLKDKLETSILMKKLTLKLKRSLRVPISLEGQV